MAWKIEFSKKAYKDFNNLNPVIKNRIDKAIISKLAKNAEEHLIPLVGSKRGVHKFKVGDYRLFCKKEKKELLVIVIKMGHRRDVYRD
jgi:mRNA interferase RelE/StbE